MSNSARNTPRDQSRQVRRWVLESVAIGLATWFAGPTVALAQNAGSQAGPPIVYVANAGGGITEINATKNSVIGTAPFENNANSVAVTPDGRRMYVSNRDIGQVTVIDTGTNVPLATIIAGNGNDNLGLAVSPDGRWVYVANQASGTVTVIYTATNKVVQVIPTGIQPIWVTFSPDSSKAYVSNQSDGNISVISTASQTIVGTIWGFSCPFEAVVTKDATELLVSSQCDNSLKVVNLASGQVTNSIPTGPNPRGIALTPDGKRAYVADWFSNTVDVIDVASQTNLNTPITVGAQPWGMAMTPAGMAYSANFGDGTVSVINTATNTVTATLQARSNPEDVTVSITARPRILSYKFVSVDVPGAAITVPVAINDRGQIVGRFQDAAGVQHGFLKEPDGSLVTIDMPGAALTGAFGINDQGVIVGQWQTVDGVANGFTRSPSGVLTTLDFPGATDTQVVGINAQGTLVGAYDLGDVNTSIGFVDARGAFTSFEDPAGFPLTTAAVGINTENFISGYYGDAAGNSHGYVRSPQGQFRNFDFPGADSTSGTRINDLGQIVGIYSTNFPNHAFVLSGAMALDGPPSSSQFFSFDYPDSRMTQARGINNLGQVVGSYAQFGSPVIHGFLAMPDQNEQ